MLASPDVILDVPGDLGGIRIWAGIVSDSEPIPAQFAGVTPNHLAGSVYASCPLDRCLRDARTAVQHVCSQESNLELAGRQLLHRLDGPSLWALDLRASIGG